MSKFGILGAAAVAVGMAMAPGQAKATWFLEEDCPVDVQPIDPGFCEDVPECTCATEEAAADLRFEIAQADIARGVAAVLSATENGVCEEGLRSGQVETDTFIIGYAHQPMASSAVGCTVTRDSQSGAYSRKGPNCPAEGPGVTF